MIAMGVAVWALVHGVQVGAESEAGASEPVVERWAGHQVSFGSRDVPFKGRQETRTDTFVLAEVIRRGDELVLRQRACAIDFKRVAGVGVRMDASHLPIDTLRFQRRPSGEFVGRSTVVWGREDIDRDGNPGMTVGVDSRVCSGDLYVSNRSQTRATASFRASRFTGSARVEIAQSILGAKGICLNVVARDTQEQVRGPFAYTPVAHDATCSSLLSSKSWPIDALGVS